MADVAERAYAAGLFDGEGCVQLYMRKTEITNGRKDRSLRCALSVAMTDMAPLFWLQERYGGNIKIDQRSGDGVRKPIGRWAVFSRQADVFAEEIFPYLITKKAQVDLWMQARKIMYEPGRRVNGIPQDELDVRRDMVYRMKELKHRG